MSIYNATELRKKFQKWFEQNPEEHKEFYRDTLKKYNKGVETSVRTAINSKLKKFTGALASSVKTNSGFGTGGSVYVTTPGGSACMERQHETRAVSVVRSGLCRICELGHKITS